MEELEANELLAGYTLQPLETYERQFNYPPKLVRLLARIWIRVSIATYAQAQGHTLPQLIRITLNPRRRKRKDGRPE